ncbi:MAG: ABC transporter ATP-binding protein [Planctomycetes bacterium]|nr:ABC transporter ATP-binding protein [Planctomycetota bacterium]
MALALVAGRGPAIGLAALTLLQTLLPLAGLVAMMQLIDAVAAGLASRLAPDQAFARAGFAVAAAAAIGFAGSAARSLQTWLGESHGRRTGDLLQERLEQHAACVPLAAFDQPSFHERLQRAAAEVSARPVRLLQDLLAVLAALVGLVVMAALLLSVASWLPVLVAATALPHAFVRLRHARQRVAWQQDQVPVQRDLGSLAAALTARSTAKDVRVLRLGGSFGARLAALRGGLHRSLRALAKVRSRDELLVTTVASLGLFGAYLVLVDEALAGGLSLGALVLQAQAAQRAQNAVRDLLAAGVAVHEHRLFLLPLVAFFAEPLAGESTPPPGAPTPPPGPLSLELRDVAFTYAEAERPALVALSLAIAAGERLAVVGPNGSGKSTLLKLLAGLYAPDRGVLTCGGRAMPCAEPAFGERRRVLLQDGALFELSLRDNLQLGVPAPWPDAVLWQALDRVGMAERVRSLPLGLDTPCSRRQATGVAWSGGEVRRLLLARALLPGGDLLLLDEPFAALDPAAARALANVLAGWPRSTTMVIVDHRADVLACCDRVLVLDAGRLVACGPLATLRQQPQVAALLPG